MRLRNGTARLWLLTLLMVAMPGAALAQVNVYAEGAYTATNLDVLIYADITGSPLCSYGVSLNYNPSKVTVASATKNENEWYFGTSTEKQPYMNPDTATAGKIVFIGGKLDTTDPMQGVSGSRKLLGKASFNRIPGQDIVFGIAMELGKTHPPFDNFVTSVAPANVLDGSANLTFGSVTVHERGDADGNGDININDVRTLRQLIGVSNASPWVDCDGNGDVDINDVRCLRQKL